MKRSITAVTVGLCMSLVVPALATAQTRAETETSQTQPSNADLRERFGQGTFRYVGGPAQAAQLDAAINQAVAPMNFVKRRVARGRLRARNTLVQTVTFRFPGEMAEVSFDGRAPFRSPLNGASAPGRAITGEALRVSQRFDHGTLVQNLASSEGVRRDEFSVSPDGSRMTMRVTITSPQLQAPMRYRLDYSK